MRAAVVALLSLAVLSTPQAAHADVPRGEVTQCATQHEFNLIRYNATRRETQELLDGPGHHPSTPGITRQVIQREYRLCGKTADRGWLIVRYSRATDRLRAALWIEFSG